MLDLDLPTVTSGGPTAVDGNDGQHKLESEVLASHLEVKLHAGPEI